MRETGFRALASMCTVMAGNALRADAGEMAEHLADGLCDSWSHVSQLRTPVLNPNCLTAPCTWHSCTHETHRQRVISAQAAPAVHSTSEMRRV